MGGTATGNSVPASNVTQQDADGNIASGNGAQSSSGLATAVGTSAQATGSGATSTGAYSAASGVYSAAYGTAANAASEYGTALGFSAQVGVSPPSGQTGYTGTAVGAYSSAQGDYSTAVGSNAVANNAYSAAIGYGSVTSSGRDNVISVGSGADSSSGGNNTAPFSDAYPTTTAPSTRIIENVTNGQYSQDAATVNQLPGQFVTSGGAASTTPTNFYRFGNDAAANAAMTTGSGSVTLQNVAPGEISPTSTDAINGSQLYNVQQQIQANGAGAVQQAQTTANQAVVAAGAAQTTANQALSAAGAAQTTATQALNLGVQNTQQIQAVNSAVAAVNQLVQANICHIVGSSITCGLQAQVMGGNTLTNPNNPANAVAATAGATAIGHRARADATKTIAVGDGALAGAQDAVALGSDAQATYAGSIAIGRGATITAPTNPKDANVTGAIAIGQGARANADPATAVGYQANAAGSDSVALGYAATANGAGSVALGAGSVANRTNSVSVGNAATGLARQITNVAPGTAGTDAVNVNQLNAAVSKVAARATAGIAQAAALAQTPIFGASGNSLTAGVGTYGGQVAIGVQYSHLLRSGEHPAFISFGVAASSGTGDVLARAGASFGW
jgi:hypothetical protein